MPKVRMVTIGTLSQIVREGGANNKDGWHYDRKPDEGYRPRGVKFSLLSKILHRH